VEGLAAHRRRSSCRGAAGVDPDAVVEAASHGGATGVVDVPLQPRPRRGCSTQSSISPAPRTWTPRTPTPMEICCLVNLVYLNLSKSRILLLSLELNNLITIPAGARATSGSRRCCPDRPLLCHSRVVGPCRRGRRRARAPPEREQCGSRPRPPSPSQSQRRNHRPARARWHGEGEGGAAAEAGADVNPDGRTVFFNTTGTTTIIEGEKCGGTTATREARTRTVQRESSGARRQHVRGRVGA
jgi:hypothetical protein